MCALRAQSAVELEPDMQHITLANHTSLALAHVALAPQLDKSSLSCWRACSNKAPVDKTSGVCIVFKEVVQILWHINYVAINIGLK